MSCIACHEERWFALAVFSDWPMWNGGREMNIASKVGSRIRTLREAAGLTQSELAATAYVTHQSVGNWERGNTLPDVQSL